MAEACVVICLPELLGVPVSRAAGGGAGPGEGGGGGGGGGGKEAQSSPTVLEMIQARGSARRPGLAAVAAAGYSGELSAAAIGADADVEAELTARLLGVAETPTQPSPVNIPNTRPARSAACSALLTHVACVAKRVTSAGVELNHVGVLSSLASALAAALFTLQSRGQSDLSSSKPALDYVVACGRRCGRTEIARAVGLALGKGGDVAAAGGGGGIVGSGGAAASGGSGKSSNDGALYVLVHLSAPALAKELGDESSETSRLAASVFVAAAADGLCAALFPLSQSGFSGPPGVAVARACLDCERRSRREEGKDGGKDDDEEENDDDDDDEDEEEDGEGEGKKRSLLYLAVIAAAAPEDETNEKSRGKKKLAPFYPEQSEDVWKSRSSSSSSSQGNGRIVRLAYSACCRGRVRVDSSTHLSALEARERGAGGKAPLRSLGDEVRFRLGLASKYGS